VILRLKLRFLAAERHQLFPLFVEWRHPHTAV
jgi:hypothetical protein